MAETHFVISRKMTKNAIIIIILAIILRDFIFNISTIFILGGFLLISMWDTSLVSTVYIHFIFLVIETYIKRSISGSQFVLFRYLNANQKYYINIPCLI